MKHLLRLLPVALLLSTALTLAAFPSQWGGACKTYPPFSPSVLSSPAVQLAFNRTFAMAERVRSAQGTPALALGVFGGDSLVWRGGFGQAGDGAAVDENTVFRIGSISKVFSVLEMLKLAEQGVLHLDTTVVSLEPRFSVGPALLPGGGLDGPITLRQLATHLAGLPRETPCGGDLNDCSKLTDDEAYARIAKLNRILPSDTRAVYSNLGFSVLGNVLATATNRTFEEMVHEDVIKPLGMSRTGVEVGSAPKDNVAEGYLAPGKPCGDECWQDFGWADPAGSFYSSVKDLSQVVKLMLSGDAVNSSGLLSPATVRADMTPLYFLNGDAESGFGLPWEVYRFDDLFLRTKRGDVGGFASEIIVSPELKLGIIVLANIMEHAQTVAQEAAGIIIPAWRAAMLASSSPPGEPSDYEAVLGTYKSTLDGPLVEIRAPPSWTGRLQAVSGGVVTQEIEFLQQVDSQLVFRTLPIDGGQASCFTSEVGDDLQLVRFHLDDKHVAFFSMDVYYGLRWMKQSSTSM